MVPFGDRAGKKIAIRRAACCLLFDTPLDLIDSHFKQMIFQTTFLTETR
jgi:hypothetical protein